MASNDLRAFARRIVDAWPQMNPDSGQYEEEVNGGDCVEWLGELVEECRAICGADEPAIEPMLVISTAHVKQPDAEWLDQMAYCDGGPVVYAKGEYGWLIPTTLSDADYPEAVRAGLAYARTLGCDWLMYDRDADTVDALPSFEWPETMIDETPDFSKGKEC